MDDRKSMLDYITQVFSLFGFTILILMCFSVLFGGVAKDFFDLFSIGKVGVSVGIMVQFFVLSVINVSLRYVFLTDRWIKKMSLVKRVACTLLTILLSIILFIILFRWFPINRWHIWALFIGCFILLTLGGTFLAAVRNKMENKKLAEGLAKIKEQWGDDNGAE